MPGPRKAADVDEQLDALIAEKVDEPRRLEIGMSDREDVRTGRRATQT
jgi:hypothetical protein